ncbi:ABC transporter substrate-binding protein [Brucella cytisi]|uniref:ABC transporter substrate-binding protein n=1 Tax=Brucella cytisi TaxID=407152 RepID=UPI0035DC89FA
MKTTYKMLLSTGAILAIAMLAAGPSMAETVRMWTFLKPEGTSPREQALAKIIKDFEAANPDINIVVEPQVWDQMSPKFLAAHANGSAPDIIWVVTDFLGDAIGSGSLVDLNEVFINKWPEEKKAAFKDAYWNLTSVDGKQYGLFASRNYIAVMYRPDLFKKAGIAPESIKSWDDFRNVAEKLTTKDASGNVSRYGFAAAFGEQQADPNPLVPRTLGSGEHLFKDDGAANFTSPATVQAAEYLADLVKDGISPAQSASWTVDDLIEQFVSGRVAMVQGAAVRVTTLQDKLGKDKVAFMLWPSSNGKTPDPAVMAGWSVGIWSGSKVQASAGKFVDYMLSEPGDAIWTTVGGQIPGMQTNLVTLQDFLKEPGNEFFSVAAKGSSEAGWLTPINIPVGGYRQELNKAMQHIIVDKAEPRAALKEAEEAFNRQHGL